MFAIWGMALNGKSYTMEYYVVITVILKKYFNDMEKQLVYNNRKKKKRIQDMTMKSDINCRKAHEAIKHNEN